MKLTPRYDGPTIISLDGPADDQRLPLTRQRRRMEAMLTDLDDDSWRVASRCDAWTAHDVVAHLVGVNEFWSASVRAGLTGTPTRMLTGFDPAATPPLLVAPMRALTPPEILERFVASNDAFLGVIAEVDDDGWSMLAESPPGHMSIRSLAHHALWDGWVHERDIALPLGSVPAIEPDEVASCLRYAAALGPAFAITAGNAARGTYAVVAREPDLEFVIDVAESVSVREGGAEPAMPCLCGDAVELLEALSLRASLPASAPARWRSVLGGLATTFDSEVPAIAP